MWLYGEYSMSIQYLLYLICFYFCETCCFLSAEERLQHPEDAPTDQGDQDFGADAEHTLPDGGEDVALDLGPSPDATEVDATTSFTVRT